jgi:outer membrane protein assembly factor BamB
MGVSRRRMQDVDLVPTRATDAADSDGPGVPPGRSPSSPDGDEPRGALSRLAWKWWPVAAGLVLVVAAGMVIADRREAARLSALAALPGILAPVNGPVRELWRSTLSLAPGSNLGSEPREVSGRLVVQLNRPGAGSDVVALDLVTGEEAWRAAVVRGGTLLTGTSCVQPGAPKVAGDASTAPVVACVVTDATDAVDTPAGEVTVTTKARLVILDASTGAAISDGPTDPSTRVIAFGSDLVISSVDADGIVRITRKDPRSASGRWTFTSADPVPRDPDGLRDVWVSATGDRMLVDAVSSWWVLSGSGDVIRTGTSPGAPVPTHIAPELTATTLFTESASAPTGVLRMDAVDLSTGRTFTAEGAPVTTAVDDGSLADSVLMESDSNLVSYDARSGLMRWTAPLPANASMLVIDGRVVCSGTTELRSIDGTTGKTLWATPVSQPDQTSQFTDGTVDVVAQQVNGQGQLTAFGLDDGEVRWNADLTNGLIPFAAGGRLYASDGKRIAALG